MQYQTKPVRVDAVQFRGISFGEIVVEGGETPRWVSHAVCNDHNPMGELSIGANEIIGPERQRCRPGFWIVRQDLRGIFFVAEAEFARAYEPISGT